MNMKKEIIIAIVFFITVLQTTAQEAVGPQIAFEETVFNFDTIMQNSIGEHVFHFTNTGDAPLVISSAFSSCGCVVPEWPKEPIAPNATSSIKVKYNTSKTGQFTKAIVVKSNNAKSPKTVLRINGVVLGVQKSNTNPINSIK